MHFWFAYCDANPDKLFPESHACIFGSQIAMRIRINYSLKRLELQKRAAAYHPRDQNSSPQLWQRYSEESVVRSVTNDLPTVVEDCQCNGEPLNDAEKGTVQESRSSVPRNVTVRQTGNFVKVSINFVPTKNPCLPNIRQLIRKNLVLQMSVCILINDAVLVCNNVVGVDFIRLLYGCRAA